MARMRKRTAPLLLVPLAVVLVAVFKLAGVFLVLALCSVIAATHVASRYERPPRSDA